MARRIFVIGIGGTGMRCLESFIHTCAMGMYDDTEVFMLALDTDKDNGNFKWLRDLKNYYRAINGDITKQDTFFSAKINYYEFSPGYTGNDSFSSISNYANLDIRRGNDPTADFLDLFLTEDVRKMSLKEGYRAQTQMGSMLMYYAIEKSAYEEKNTTVKGGLKDFLSELNSAQKQPVFIFGSVFGGTGASSIPILPLALEKANSVFKQSANNVVKDNYFGSIILTNYFKFSVEAAEQEVVARSEKFAINSQAALMFYNSDNTVKDTYKRLYLLGRSSDETRDVLAGENKNGGSVGGGSQKNPADYIELLAASAAYDFFSEAGKEDPFPTGQDRFYCLSHDFGNDKLDFKLFFQNDHIFRQKIGALTVASILDKESCFFDNVIKDNMFVNVDKGGKQMDALHKYFELFNFGIAADKATLTKGWLHQMYNGRGGQGILFGERLFECKTISDVHKLKYNKELFVGENPPKFSVNLISNIFDTVSVAFSKTDTSKDSSFDDLITRTYHTIRNLYNLQ